MISQRKINRRIALAYLVSYLLIMSSCENKNDVNREFWTPLMKVEQGDGQATLLLSNPLIFSNYFGKPPANPDYFDVMVSDDQQNFTLYKRVDVTTNTLVIEDLKNDKPYYFFVQALKGDQPVNNSQTVMTIPAKGKKTESFVNDGAQSTRLELSLDHRYLSYFNSLAVYVRRLGTGSPKAADDNVQDFKWSPTEDLAVYSKYNLVGNTLYSHELRILHPESNTSELILQIPNHEFSLLDPQFTPAGDKLTFLSTEHSSDGILTEVWNLDLATLEKTQISSFSSSGFYAIGKLNWSALADELYLDGCYSPGTEKYSIYSWSPSSKVLTPVIKSSWNDTRPSLSPNNNVVAFVSDRSGKDEVWTYNKTNQVYTQITGGYLSYFASHYSNIHWLNDTQILITIIENDHWKAVKIDLE